MIKEVNDMRNLKKFLGVFLLLVLNASFLLMTVELEAGWLIRFNQWFGLNILMSMTFVFLLSIRNQSLDRLLGDIKQKAAIRRLTIILSLSFIYAHVVISYVIRSSLFSSGTFNVTALFTVVTYVVLGLIVLLLLIHASKLTNQLYLHTVMMLVFGIAIYHAFTSLPSLLSFSVLSVWVATIIFVGLVAMVIPPIQFVQSQLAFQKSQKNKSIKVLKP
jgi:predicted ferric reductase